MVRVRLHSAKTVVKTVITPAVGDEITLVKPAPKGTVGPTPKPVPWYIGIT